MSSYVNNYNTMHTKFQSRDNYGEGCRRVIAKASGTQIEIPDDTSWGESNEMYFEALLTTEHQLVQAKGNIKTHYKIVRTLDRAKVREHKSPSRRKSSDAKRTSSGDSGDSESDQPGDPPRHYLNSSSKKPHCIKQNSFTISRRLASCQCPMAQGVA
jgi:hypothetical protein